MPDCPPGPTGSSVESSGVGDEGAVDDVGDLSLQRPDCFFGTLALGSFAVVVLAALTGVAELGDHGDVDRIVELTVAARVEPVALLLTR